MQFMYLRKSGSKKNPGRHPVGILGIKLEGSKLAIAVSTIHSSDNFQKTVARDIIQRKLYNETVATIDIPTGTLPELFTLLPKNFARRINYVHHSKCFARMVEDELNVNSPYQQEQVRPWTGIGNSI